MNKKANIGMTLIVILSFILLSYATLVFSRNVSGESQNLGDFVEVLKLNAEIENFENNLDDAVFLCFVESYSSILNDGGYIKNPFSYIGKPGILGLSNIKEDEALEEIFFPLFAKCFNDKFFELSGSLKKSRLVKLPDLNSRDNFVLREDFFNFSLIEDSLVFQNDLNERIHLNYSSSYSSSFNVNEIGLIGFRELENIRKSCGGIVDKDLIKECFSSLNNNFDFEIDSFFIGEKNNSEEKFVIKLISKKSFYGKKVEFSFVLV